VARTVFKILRVSVNTMDPCSGLKKLNRGCNPSMAVPGWLLPWRVEQCLLIFSSRFDFNLTALVPEIIDPRCRYTISSRAAISEFGFTVSFTSVN
jgi:hypothetical protein